MCRRQNGDKRNNYVYDGCFQNKKWCIFVAECICEVYSHPSLQIYLQCENEEKSPKKSQNTEGSLQNVFGAMFGEFYTTKR